MAVCPKHRILLENFGKGDWIEMRCRWPEHKFEIGFCVRCGQKNEQRHVSILLMGREKGAE